MCDRLMIMDNGRIAEQAETKELFSNPRTFIGARVTGCKNISRIRDLGEGMVEAVDFGIRLCLGDGGLENVTAVGIRAHDFEAVYEDVPRDNISDRRKYDIENVNLIEIDPENAEIIASPFEDTVVFSPPGSRCRLWWKRKDKGAEIPSKVCIDPSKIMRLSDGIHS